MVNAGGELVSHLLPPLLLSVPFGLALCERCRCCQHLACSEDSPLGPRLCFVSARRHLSAPLLLSTRDRQWT